MKSILFIIALTVILQSCQPGNKIVTKCGLIEHFGLYECHNYHIEVSKRNGFLYYKVNYHDKVLIQSQENSSIYSQWYVYWDNRTRRLWIVSSDIGLFVWVPNTESNYKEITLYKESVLLKDIPLDLKDKMPTAFKNFLNK